jgi:hypothetical protein
MIYIHIVQHAMQFNKTGIHIQVYVCELLGGFR